MTESSTESNWYSVRCVFRALLKDRTQTFEERLLLWQASDIDEAIALAEAEAAEYAAFLELEYLGLAQAYWLPDAPGHGVEVFSLYRDNELPSEEYLDRFFDTGSERQRTSEEDE